MTPADLEAYLHANIPLSAAMGVRVVGCEPAGVTLRAPLGPNINHHATVFGGSASAVAILAGWSTVHVALRQAGLEAGLVIRGNTMRYLAPISGDFEARGAGVSPGEFDHFRQTLQRLGRARLTVTATLHYEGRTAAAFSGDYVAIRPA